MNHRIYLGLDRRELTAYRVAEHSLRRHASVPLSVTPLDLMKLEEQGLMTRPRAWKDGHMWDVISGAPMSTDFANSRFLTPLLAQEGWAAFMDSDVVALADVAGMFAQRDNAKAVMVVKHKANDGTGAVRKMDGQIQTHYLRKNWSSVMLFNCDHPANASLNLRMINSLPGRDLHAFCWLDDRYIGELEPEWNWLVGVQDCEAPKLAHFTLGGPWFKGWQEKQHDGIWIEAAEKAGVPVLRESAERV